MKLRIRGNTVRLRLQRAELIRLCETGLVCETLLLASSEGVPFRYQVQTLPGEQLQLHHRDGVLSVGMPQTWAEDLLHTPQTGYTAELPAAAGGLIRVTIEKDFESRLDRPCEDDSDAFPNPGACIPPAG